MSMPFLAMLVFFPGAMAYAAASDLVSMTISNRLCLLLFAGFIVCATLAGLSPQQFAAHVAAGALVRNPRARCRPARAWPAVRTRPARTRARPPASLSPARPCWIGQCPQGAWRASLPGPLPPSRRWR